MTFKTKWLQKISDDIWNAGLFTIMTDKKTRTERKSKVLQRLAYLRKSFLLQSFLLIADDISLLFHHVSLNFFSPPICLGKVWTVRVKNVITKEHLYKIFFSMEKKIYTINIKAKSPDLVPWLLWVPRIQKKVITKLKL